MEAEERRDNHSRNAEAIKTSDDGGIEEEVDGEGRTEGGETEAGEASQEEGNDDDEEGEEEEEEGTEEEEEEEEERISFQKLVAICSNCS